MAQPFQLCILFGDDPGRPPAAIGPGWDMAEIPVGPQMNPFMSDAHWAQKKAEIANWGLAPIKASSHFLDGYGLVATGPEADWEQLQFWTKRAFDRLAEMKVEVVGVYGAFFIIPDGYSRTTVMDQTVRFTNLLADHAERHGILVALEPMAQLNTLWPRYLDGLAFAKEINRPSIKVMADQAYFLKLDQPLEDILKAPEYCLHCHIAGVGGQPGLGDRVAAHTKLFRILRDIGYTRGVSAACPWASSTGIAFDFGAEAAKSLKYLQNLRERVYSDS